MPKHVRFQTLAAGALAGLLLCLGAGLTACAAGQDGMQDGYYTAEAAEFDAFGWKEYLIICVRDGRIVTADYNAKNASGMIKSWDMDYMRTMNAADGTYPNEYTRAYADALLEGQSPAGVDVMAGATHSHHTFQLLAQAAIAQATAKDKSIAYVDVPSYE